MAGQIYIEVFKAGDTQSIGKTADGKYLLATLVSDDPDREDAKLKIELRPTEQAK